ncbi:DMT family transporter [Pleionea sediminis]|uniref:DMT family transporter n=1 Tax=Pleionea sediminis TaxID=2569479 RepID=UPI0013DE5E97|nr:DMT family transporter [Pleionea sediminis]
MSQHLKAAITLVATIFIAALVTVLAKVSLERVSAFSFNWLQILVAMVFLTGYTFLWRKESLPTHLTRAQWLYILAIGFCNFTMVRFLFLAGLELLPVTTHAYLVNFVGLVTMFLSIFLLNERPYLIQFLGALIALSGLTVYFDSIPTPERISGIIFVALGVFFLALTNNLIRRFMVHHKSSVSSVMLSTLAIWIGGLPLVAIGILTEGSELTIGLNDALIILANGVFSLALTLIVFNHVMKVLRSYEASLLASTGVIFVALLAIPINHEILSQHQVIGISILFIGIILTQFKIPFLSIFRR